MKRIVFIGLVAAIAVSGERTATLSAGHPPLAAPHLVVVLGDSVAHGAGDESGAGGIAPRLGAINAGINGARTWNVIALMRQPRVRATLRDAGAVVLSIGGNDLYGDTRARLFSLFAPDLMMRLTLGRVDAIVRTLEGENPTLHVYLLGLYDPYRRRDLDVAVAKWNALLLRQFAGDSRVSVVMIADLFSRPDRVSPTDHFHPSADAYARIARRVADAF